MMSSPPTPPALLGPGAYRIPAEAYHADPCERPSLSASIAHTLLTRSPRHAQKAHPRLNPYFRREHDSKFDMGSAAHALLLGEKARFEIVEAADWRAKAAREQRDRARADGKLPILGHQYNRAKAMADAAHAQLSAHEIGNPFPAGTPETTLVWLDGPADDKPDVLCRALLDWCPANPESAIDWFDYKTVDGSAHPEGIWYRLAGTGADVQQAFYRRAIRSVFGVTHVSFRFIVQEIEEPYALSVVELDPAAQVIADKRMDDALLLWRRCVKENRWPGYPSRVATIGAPGHYEQRQMDRENRAELDREAGRDWFKMMMDWQAPNPTMQMLEESAEEISP